MSKKMELDAPDIGIMERRHLNKALESGYVSSAGPLVGEFENRFARYLGVRHAVSTQSGTAAIHIALHELGVGKDDEVIVPALTFVATVNPILYVGARPVFADVEPDSWNIDPDDVARKITDKTKAIIPVHLYGNPCALGKIMEIAKKHSLYVIEDATESLSARYRRKFTGTFGDFGCFSFNGNKIITTGGGGMIIGRDPQRLKHIKFLVNQARDDSGDYYHPEVGFNYRMTNMEAALGIAQLTRLGGFIKKKSRINRIYKEELSGSDSVIFQKELERAESSWWMTCILVDKIKDISSVQRKLAREKIPTRRVFAPLPGLPPYEIYKKGYYANAYVIYKKGLCLPSSTLNSEGDVRCAAKKIRKVLKAEGVFR